MASGYGKPKRFSLCPFDITIFQKERKKTSSRISLFVLISYICNKIIKLYLQKPK